MKRRAGVVAAVATVLAGTVATTASGGTSQSSERVTIGMAGSPPNFRFTGVSKTMEAGRVTFRFRNTSRQGIRHNFTIVDTLGGGRAFRSRTLDGGQSETKSVNLTAGTYIALCTIGDGFHAANGMLRAFTVE